MSSLRNNYKLPRLMGILNLTEDSFSDGAMFLDPQEALKHADQMIADGAEIIDIGAESTRPGAIPVALETELERVLPILKAIKAKHPDICCSIDTRKAEVAAKSIKLGAEIINDVSALAYDPEMVRILARNSHTKVILMHMQGEPQTMQLNPQYQDVVSDLAVFFAELIHYSVTKGIRKANIMVDPGIGFGKNLEHNLKLLANLDCIAPLEVPIVLGASRKSFINAIDPSEPGLRLGGSLAATAWGILKGVEIIRVHDVKAHLQFAKVFLATAKYEEVSECPF